MTLFLLFIFVAMTTWLVIRLNKDQPTSALEDSKRADSYMRDFTRTDMDVNGQIKSRLKAEFMEHFPEDDSTVLTKPYLEVFKEGRNTWYISASHGWVNSGSTQVKLTGDVKAWKNDEYQQKEVEVLSEKMTVFPKNDYAETDDQATIITNKSATVAIGMRANFNTQRMELFKQVKSRFDDTNSEHPAESRQHKRTNH